MAGIALFSNILLSVQSEGNKQALVEQYIQEKCWLCIVVFCCINFHMTATLWVKIGLQLAVYFMLATVYSLKGSNTNSLFLFTSALRKCPLGDF